MKKTLSRLWQNEYTKGGVLFTISAFTANLLNYFFNLLSGRILGPVGYGEIVSLMSYVTILSVPITVMSTLVVQKIGSKDDDRFVFAKKLETWVGDKLRKWWPLIIIPFFFIPFIPQITNLTPLTGYILIPLVALAYVSTFYYASLQGMRLFSMISLLGVLTVVIKLLGPTLSIFFVNNFLVILIFLFLSNVFNVVTYIKVFRNSVRSIKKIKEKINKRVLAVISNPIVLTTTLSIFSITLLNNLDIIFVKKFLTAREAGMYGAWSLLAKVIFYFASPILSICLVYFSSKKNPGSQRKVLILSLMIFAIIGVSSFVVYTFFAPFVVQMFFGSKFLGIMEYLPQASLFGTMYAVCFFINNYFIAKESKLSLIMLAAIFVYAMLLFNINKELASIMNLNVIFTAALMGVYLIATIFVLNYNKRK